MRTVLPSPFFLCPPFIQPKILAENFPGTPTLLVDPRYSIRSALSFQTQRPWLLNGVTQVTFDLLRPVYMPYFVVFGEQSTAFMINTANKSDMSDEAQTFGPFQLKDPRFGTESLGRVLAQLPVTCRFVQVIGLGNYITSVFLCDSTSIVQPAAGFRWSLSAVPRETEAVELGDLRRVNRRLGPLKLDLKCDVDDPLFTDLVFRLNESAHSPIIFAENLDWEPSFAGSGTRVHCVRFFNGLQWVFDPSGTATASMDVQSY